MSTLRPTTRLRRAAGVGLAGLLVGAVLVAAPASAHVTIQPGTVEGGGYTVVAVRVPNERDDAATTRVRVLLPTDQPLTSVQTTPVPGWRVTTAQRELDEPVEVSGSEVTTVVSEVTWSAVDGGVRPGEFQDFALSLGQLPESGELVFKAVQGYDSGERVAWNEVAVDDTAEPEHPAPVLSVTPPAEPAAAAGAEATDDVGDGDEGDNGSAIPLALSVVALLTALAALVLGLKRRTG